MIKSNTSLGNYITSIKSRNVKLFIMMLSILGIICSSGLAIIFTMFGQEYGGLGIVFAISIVKAIIMISFIVIILQSYLKINRISIKPDLIMNYLIAYLPYIVILFVQGCFINSITNSTIETSGTIQSSISAVQLLKYFGIPLIVIFLRLSPLVAQYSLNRDYLELNKGKSIQLLCLLSIPIIFSFLVGL